MAIDNQDVRWFVALGVLMLLVFAYIYMPRYDVRTLGDEQFRQHRRDRPLDRADSACRVRQRRQAARQRRLRAILSGASSRNQEDTKTKMVLPSWFRVSWRPECSGAMDSVVDGRAAANGNVTSTRKSIRNSESPKLYSKSPAASIDATAARAVDTSTGWSSVPEETPQINRQNANEYGPNDERWQSTFGRDLHRAHCGDGDSPLLQLLRPDIPRSVP